MYIWTTVWLDKELLLWANLKVNLKSVQATLSMLLPQLLHLTNPWEVLPQPHIESGESPLLLKVFSLQHRQKLTASSALLPSVCGVGIVWSGADPAHRFS